MQDKVLQLLCISQNRKEFHSTDRRPDIRARRRFNFQVIFFKLSKLKGEKYFKDEITDSLRHKRRGTVSMANIGPNTNASQFFITLKEDLDFLDDKYTIFGQVEEGFDVLDKLNQSLLDDSFRPLSDVIIYHTFILDDPFDDPEGLIVPESPKMTKFIKENLRILDNTLKSKEEIELEREASEARSQALTLEMLGDLPAFNSKPKENTLFICRLNPITRESDLKTIFSRFGRIVGCKISRDESGESKGFGFIEFEDKETCDEAYLKMDNVLIDDRRIKVDFSQSAYGMKQKKQSGSKFQVRKKYRKDDFELV